LDKKTLAEFHGHFGPYAALGARAGLLAREKLGQGYKAMRARVKLPLRTPYSCFLDGLQFTSCCTVGKRNIEFEEGEFSVEFISPKGSLLLVPKEGLAETFKVAFERREGEAMAKWVLSATVDELFEVL